MQAQAYRATKRAFTAAHILLKVPRAHALASAGTQPSTIRGRPEAEAPFHIAQAPQRRSPLPEHSTSQRAARASTSSRGPLDAVRTWITNACCPRLVADSLSESAKRLLSPRQRGHLHHSHHHHLQAPHSSMDSITSSNDDGRAVSFSMSRKTVTHRALRQHAVAVIWSDKVNTACCFCPAAHTCRSEVPEPLRRALGYSQPPPPPP